jgi:hypothetical protein
MDAFFLLGIAAFGLLSLGLLVLCHKLMEGQRQ